MNQRTSRRPRNGFCGRRCSFVAAKLAELLVAVVLDVVLAGLGLPRYEDV